MRIATSQISTTRDGRRFADVVDVPAAEVMRGQAKAFENRVIELSEREGIPTSEAMRRVEQQHPNAAAAWAESYDSDDDGDD
jgi:hypothetical protein